MSCWKCSSDCSSVYTIDLRKKSKFGKNRFKAKVESCDKCMFGWYDHIVAITKHLPDGSWSKE